MYSCIDCSKIPSAITIGISVFWIKWRQQTEENFNWIETNQQAFSNKRLFSWNFTNNRRRSLGTLQTLF